MDWCPRGNELAPCSQLVPRTSREHLPLALGHLRSRVLGQEKKTVREQKMWLLTTRQSIRPITNQKGFVSGFVKCSRMKGQPRCIQTSALKMNMHTTNIIFARDTLLE